MGDVTVADNPDTKNVTLLVTGCSNFAQRMCFCLHAQVILSQGGRSQGGAIPNNPSGAQTLVAQTRDERNMFTHTHDSGKIHHSS